MRKYLKSVISLIMIFILVLSINNTNVAQATDMTGTYDFITGVTLTDRAGNPLGSNVSKNTDIKLTYNYAIPNKGDIQKGDSFQFKIPEQIKIENGGEFDILDTNLKLIATGFLEQDGTITITFTDYAEIYSNISGYFYFELGFEESKIGTDESTIIKFELGGTAKPVEITVDFEQPAPPEPAETSIQKYGNYDSATNEITWNITVNRENVVVNNARVEDILSENLEFVPNSVNINGSKALTEDYTYDEITRTFTYTFPTQIATGQALSFKTKVKDTVITGLPQGSSVFENNKATLYYDNTSKDSNNASVQITVNYINKYGNYNSSTKKIDWTIEVNQSGINIPDAVITDTLPLGLTLDSSSVYIDDILSNDYNYTGSIITFDLVAIAEKHTIRFSTTIEESAYQTNGWKYYYNNAVLTGTGVPSNTNSGYGAGFNSNIITKEGIKYDRKTGEITWRVTVNANKISIENPVITDEIPVGQEYVDNSASINNGGAANRFTYVKTTAGDTKKTGTLTYSFGTTITDTYTIEFKTKVTDPSIYAGNANLSYKNTVSIEGDNLTKTSTDGYQQVYSQVINKSGSGYDYSTRIITWNVKINENQMELSNGIFTDLIPKGTEYVEDSARLDGKKDPGFTYVAAGTEDMSKTGTLTYTFPNKINKEYTITFQTKITDLNIFQTNGGKEVKNTGSLKHDLITKEVEHTGSQYINNTVVSKEASYQNGRKYIDWTVNINTNDIPLNDAIITDQLQEGLTLDTVSVKLYHQSIDQYGNLVKGAEITLGAENIQYDITTRLFTFKLPSPTSGGYRLEFRTLITDKSKSPFTNSVTFNGTGSLQSGSSGQVYASWSGSGSSGTGENGSITIYKVDREDPSIKIEGATFTLIDPYGQPFATGTTGADGSVVFDMLRFDVAYSIKESGAPEGYTLSDEIYEFTINSSDTNKDITYEYEDSKINGNIEFQKLGINDTPLAGAEFTLYNQSNTAVATAISKGNGQVLFTNVPYGSYTIRETNPPKGYVQSDEVLTAVVLEDGVTVTANPTSISNQVIKGNITLAKTNEAGDETLAGAEFTLYAADDVQFTTPIGTAVTGSDGIALFSNVSYGDYVLKETEAPEGYAISKVTLPVQVREEGKTYDLGNFANQYVRGNILFHKLGVNDTPLAGAEFTLYDQSNQVVATATSSNSGEVLFTNVPYGVYTIKETNPPTGYLHTEEVLTAAVVVNGVTVAANPASISNEIIKGNITLTKTNSAGDKTLAGAEFTLYTSDDVKFATPIAIAVTGNDGIALFSNIPYGTYVIKETGAPIGYYISSDTLSAQVSEEGKTYDLGTFINELIPPTVQILGSIELLKTNSGGEPLEGAIFGLYNSLGELIAQVTSNDKGISRFTNLDYGHYTIVELEAPHKYVKSDEVLKANITSNGLVLNYTVVNELIKEPIEPKPEQPKPEQPKPEQPKPEEPKPEQPKPEQPKPEEPKPEQPKPEEPDTEEPKPEKPDKEKPKPDNSKPESNDKDDTGTLGENDSKGEDNTGADHNKPSDSGKTGLDQSPKTSDPAHSILGFAWIGGLSSGAWLLFSSIKKKIKRL